MLKQLKIIFSLIVFLGSMSQSALAGPTGAFLDDADIKEIARKLGIADRKFHIFKILLKEVDKSVPDLVMKVVSPDNFKFYERNPDGSMSSHEANVYVLLFSGVTKVPEEQREDVINKFARLLKNTSLSPTHGVVYEVSHWIYHLGDIDQRQRGEIVNLVIQLYLTTKFSSWDLLMYLNELPQGPERPAYIGCVRQGWIAAKEAGQIPEDFKSKCAFFRDILLGCMPGNVVGGGSSTEIHRFAETEVVVPGASDQSGAVCKETPKKKKINEAITENIEGRLKGAKVKIVDLDEAKRVTAEAIDRVYPCPTSGECPRHRQALRALGIIVENAEGQQYLPLTITFLQYFHPDKLDLWTQQSMGESTEAYGENTMSCTKGIQERIFTGLRGIDKEIDKLISPVEGLFILKNAFTDSNIGDKDSAKRMARRLIDRGYRQDTKPEEALEMYRKYMIEKMREAGVENDKNYQDQLKTLMETIEDSFDEKLKPVLEELLTKGSPAGSREHSRSSSPKVRATSRSRSFSPVRLGPASDDLDTRRRLIAEQDVAYEASLRADQEKERRRREEAATNQAGPDETSRPLSPGKLRKARLKALEKKNPKAKKDSDSEE